MTTLDEYKEYLINYYRWPIDNNEDRRKERAIYLSERYSDQYLQKIIDDTYSFIKDIFLSDTIKKGYCMFDVDENPSSYIKLAIHGGGFSDNIYIDSEKRCVSEYLLKRIFGEYLIVELRENEIEYESGDDIFGIRCEYSLYMQGFPQNVDEIKEKLFGKNKKLIKGVDLSA